jgi:hypothetical protein
MWKGICLIFVQGSDDNKETSRASKESEKSERGKRGRYLAFCNYFAPEVMNKYVEHFVERKP